ncbi:hypothetical protein [Thalassotalea sediminis]|uniref:hypothetical protein n=1 Tax=Thalassotalea sediminis TaxID=1759089 RepID=UPI002573249F|nr:hypothetical protein [Thalassotalea sediminis]
MKIKTKVVLFCSVLLASFASYAVWKNAFTVVYYSDSSMSQVVGYTMYYCQSTTPQHTGGTSQYSATLDGGSCSGNAIPPRP